MARKLTEDRIRERAIRVKYTGRLTFLHPSKDRHMYIVCQCTCGTVKEIRIDSFERGDSTSCGCLAAEKARERLSTRGGMSDHPLYQAWFDMNRRCYYPSRKDYHHYGGRGIEVCERWRHSNPDGFVNFLKDAGLQPKGKLEIDRKDTNGNYCPENFQWSSRRGQTNNLRNNSTATCKGFELTLAEWGYLLDVKPNLIRDRIDKLGWTDEDALCKPFNTKYKEVLVDGELMRMGKVLKMIGGHWTGFYNRNVSETAEAYLSRKLGKNIKILPNYQGRDFQDVLYFLNGADLEWVDDYCNDIRIKARNKMLRWPDDKIDVVEVINKLGIEL
jgi:hypothetical protein